MNQYKYKQIMLDNGVVICEPRSKTILVLMMLAVAVIISVKVTEFDLGLMIERGSQFFILIDQMFLPKFSYMSWIWTPLFDTIKMSLLGSVIGGMVAIPIAVLASSNMIKKKSIIVISRLFLSVIRTFPTLVTALISTYVFGLGTLAGTIAIGVFTFAYVGKQLYEQIETVDMGPYESVEALGAGKVAAFISAIVPQVMPIYIATCLFCFEGNVRYASVLGYVGAGGLGMILNEKIGWREYSSVGMILVALFFTVALIECISHYLRTKLS